MPNKNLVRKGQREASLLHFLSSLWSSCGDTPRAALQPWGIFRALVPFPSLISGGRASGGTAVSLAAGGQRRVLHPSPVGFSGPF